jgi:hypothetical protein
VPQTDGPHFLNIHIDDHLCGGGYFYDVDFLLFLAQVLYGYVYQANIFALGLFFGYTPPPSTIL